MAMLIYQRVFEVTKSLFVHRWFNTIKEWFKGDESMSILIKWSLDLRIIDDYWWWLSLQTLGSVSVSWCHTEVKQTWRLLSLLSLVSSKKNGPEMWHSTSAQSSHCSSSGPLKGSNHGSSVSLIPDALPRPSAMTAPIKRCFCKQVSFKNASRCHSKSHLSAIKHGVAPLFEIVPLEKYIL